jgi:hypothetical protein
MIRVKNDWFKPEVGKALANAIAECERAGFPITVNEGFRPLGVPADQNVRDERKTSTGGSNQHYVYGVHKRGGPLAATPKFSNHGWGISADVNPGRGNPTVKSIFAKHGFSFTIASESWHCDYVGAPTSSSSTELQALLNRFGYGLTVDGVAGPKTIAAVRDFQSKHGLAVDGVAGPLTLAALRQGPVAPSSSVNVNDWKSLQTFLKASFGYTGVVDGIPGPKTWTAVQKWLKASHGYTGVTDGIPGPLTYAALKRAGSSLR